MRLGAGPRLGAAEPFVLTWQVNGYWAFDPDPAHASEIEVRFTAETDVQTLVTLEHRHLDRLVEGAVLRDQIERAGGGWSSVLQRFAEVGRHSDRH